MDSPYKWQLVLRVFWMHDVIVLTKTTASKTIFVHPRSFPLIVFTLWWRQNRSPDAIWDKAIANPYVGIAPNTNLLEVDFIHVDIRGLPCKKYCYDA